MSNVFDFTIVGNNIAALVAAHSLNSNNSVALINPTPVWGAHFGGSMAVGERYDLGMNFFEFTSLNDKSNDIRTYDASVKNDCGRFFHLVEDYVRKFVEVHEVATPQMFVDGQYLKDAIIANQFNELSKLSAEWRVKIIKELEGIVEHKHSLHASNKKIDEKRFIENTYKLVSIANHGETFHDFFIEPLCQKILNISSEKIPALFHRVAWAPLLYPETLLAFLRNGNNQFPKTTFHYPKSGYFSILVEHLLAEVKQKKNVTIVQAKPSRVVESSNFRIELTDTQSIDSKKLVWAMDLGQYLKLRENLEPESFEKTSIAMTFVNIKSDKIKRKISALNVLDDRYSIYRIANQTFSSGQDNDYSKLVIELNYDYHRKKNSRISEEELACYAVKSLQELNIIEDTDGIKNVTIKVMQNVLNLPTLDNFNRFQRMQDRVRNSSRYNLHLLAQSSGYSSTSLNDQIVQGLKIGALFN